jgi:carbonic anhydrase/acetyltransferase-like protein (isoleucine patch superfamily)
MIIGNDKKIAIIGYPQSTLTQEYFDAYRLESEADVQIVPPEDFNFLEQKETFQYTVSLALNLKERYDVIKKIQLKGLDFCSFIHDTCFISPRSKIGSNVFIGCFNSVLLNSQINDHCIIETYCLIAHNTTIGENCILHSGTLIAGRTVIGNHCFFGFRSSVLNNLYVTDNVIVNAFSNISKNVQESGTYSGRLARKVSK